jgi:adenylate cyclase
LSYVSLIHLLRRERFLAYQAATELLALAREQGFQHYVGFGTLFQGFGIVDCERREEGLHYIREGWRILRTLRTAGGRSIGLSLLLEVHAKLGNIEEGLNLTKTWFATENTNSDYQAEAELYRLKGELTLQQFKVQRSKFKVEDKPESKAEEYFWQAIEIARKQQAKSLELRAVMSLVRLRQQQATQHATRITQHESRSALAEAHKLLSEIYNWFTEGFDTKDLQEAKALLESLESGV